MTRRQGSNRIGVVALAMVVAAGCSHASAASGQYEPTISTARLSDVPPNQLGDVQVRQAELDQAKAARDQSKQEVKDADNRLQVAKDSLAVAKKQLDLEKQRAETSHQPVSPGAEQRAAQEQPAQPGAYPPVSDLYAAQLKQNAAKAEVDYLQKFDDYASARQKVADKLVGSAQAKVDQSVFDTLQRTRPEEASSMKHHAAWYASEVAKRQADLADARAKMDEARGVAMQRYDSWQSAYAKVRPSDRPAPAPAPDSLPPL